MANNPLRKKSCPPTPAQQKSVFATSCPGGEPRLNGLTAPRLSGNVLYIDGRIINVSPFEKPVIASAGVLLPNGTQAEPSLAFIDEFATGMYKSSPGEITFTVGNTPSLRVTQATTYTAPEITTFGGADLSLNPGGPNINFNGKNLIGVGGISTDPNKIIFSSGTPVVTADDTPTTIATIATTTDNTYSVNAVISCISTVDNESSASLKLFAKGKNISGVVSVNAGATHLVTIADDLLQDPSNVPLVSATLGVSGSDITVQAVGISGIGLRWYATGEATLVGI